MRKRERERIFKRFMAGSGTANLAYEFRRYMPETMHGEARRLLVEQAIRDCKKERKK